MSAGRKYSDRLGVIRHDQLQAALDRFGLGKLVAAEPIPIGLFGQNLFLRSTSGDFALRGAPHFSWQFAAERFHTRLLHERTRVRVPWPYLVEPDPSIFGWSFAIMPRMPGLQTGDPQAMARITPADRRAIVVALSENLASMRELTWPFPGRYAPEQGIIAPLSFARELAWPFPAARRDPAGSAPPSYARRVVAVSRVLFARTCRYGSDTTGEDLQWVDDVLASARAALDVPCMPSFVMEDYKEQNAVFEPAGDGWRVCGIFDLMGGHFGDGEADLSRSAAQYLDEDPALARLYLETYLGCCPPRPGFAERFAAYMLLDRAVIWEYVQRVRPQWWQHHGSLRSWAERYTSALSSLGIVA